MCEIEIKPKANFTVLFIADTPENWGTRPKIQRGTYFLRREKHCTVSCEYRLTFYCPNSKPQIQQHLTKSLTSAFTGSAYSPRRDRRPVEMLKALLCR